jgi:hypothetical protein
MNGLETLPPRSPLLRSALQLCDIVASLVEGKQPFPVLLHADDDPPAILAC